MEKVLDKISEYEIVNNFVPGVIYLFFLNHFCNIDIQFIEEGALQIIVFSYFLGALIGRFGSLIIEPILKWIKLIKHVDYAEFIDAEKKDEKIQILLKVTNMYRTFTAMMIFIAITKLLDILIVKHQEYKVTVFWGAIIFAIVVFLAAYVKQTTILGNRVKKVGKVGKK